MRLNPWIRSLNPAHYRFFLCLGLLWTLGLLGVALYLSNSRPLWECEDPSLKVCQCPPKASPKPDARVEKWCPRYNRRLAVFVPFFGECERVIEGIIRWSEEEFFPCSQDEQIMPSVDLIFSSGMSQKNPERCDVAISQYLPLIERCFQSILFYHDDLEAENHDRGSRFQFWKMLERLSNTYSFVFLMESDTFPIRRNWLGKLQKESWCGDDFLVKGSHFRRANRAQIADISVHINGNALYNLNSSQAGWILDAVQTREKAYDVAMGRMLQDINLAERTKELVHLYRYSDFIQNIFHKTKWNSHAMAKRFPNTYFVHGKNYSDEVGDPNPFQDLELSGYWAQDD